MADAEAEIIAFLQVRMRTLEHQLYQAEQDLKERDRTIPNLQRNLEEHRRNAIVLSEYERPAVVAEILEFRLRSWPRMRWHALADRIRPSETRP